MLEARAALTGLDLRLVAPEGPLAGREPWWRSTGEKHRRQNPPDGKTWRNGGRARDFIIYRRWRSMG